MTAARAQMRAGDRVSNQRLRKEFLRRRDAGWLTAELVAERMDWHNRGRPDVSRVLRLLGVSGCVARNGRRYKQKTVRRDSAVGLAEAMGLDPVDVGL